jgi:tryptophan-rich sensory protein
MAYNSVGLTPDGWGDLLTYVGIAFGSAGLSWALAERSNPFAIDTNSDESLGTILLAIRDSREEKVTQARRTLAERRWKRVPGAACQPPAPLLLLIWVLLYGAYGVAGFLLEAQGYDAAVALDQQWQAAQSLWVVGLCLMTFWDVVYHGFNSPKSAVVVLLLLVLSNGAATVMFAQSTLAGCIIMGVLSLYFFFTLVIVMVVAFGAKSRAATVRRKNIDSQPLL